MISYLFFCGGCGEVYARVPQGSAKNWHSCRGRCEACGPEGIWWRVGGSVWIEWDKDFLAHLPEELIKREFNLHINELLRQEQTHVAAIISWS